MLVLIYKRLSNYLVITPFESSNTGAISANETRSLVALVLTVGLWPSFQSIFGCRILKGLKAFIILCGIISSSWTKIYFNLICFKVSKLSSQYMQNIKLELIKCFIEVIIYQYYTWVNLKEVLRFFLKLLQSVFVFSLCVVKKDSGVAGLSFA